MISIVSKLNGFMAKSVAALFFLSICSLSYAAEVSTDVRCFSSPDDSVALELRLYSDSEMWVGGLVHYRGMEDFIPLVFSHRETEEVVTGRPWKFKNIWLEVHDGEVNGQYEIYSQGAIIYDFVYEGRQSGKRVNLSEESQPENTWLDVDGVCAW